MGLAYLAEWWISESVHEGKLRRVLNEIRARNPAGWYRRLG